MGLALSLGWPLKFQLNCKSLFQIEFDRCIYEVNTIRKEESLLGIP